MLFPSLKKTQSEAGFTILEVLVVIIIIGILGALAAPSWLAYATRQRMTAVESDLVQLLRQAQETAITQRQTVTVQIVDQDPSVLPTVNITASGNTRSETLGPNELRPGMITLNAPDVPNNQISFDYQGTASGQEANIPFVVNIVPSTGSQRQCVIVATILGNIKATNDGAQCDNPTL